MKAAMKLARAAIACGLLHGVVACKRNELEAPRAASGPDHIWRSSCGYCHGVSTGAPELRGAGLPPEAIILFAQNGAPGMPPFHASEISDAELEDLANWISKTPPPAKQP